MQPPCRFRAGMSPAPRGILSRASRVKGGPVMRTLGIKRGNFAAVVYTPDGRTLISLNSRRHVRFWDLATFAERLSFALPAGTAAYDGRLQLAGDLLIANGD